MTGTIVAPPLAQTPRFVDVAEIVCDTEAEGPGRRFAIWVQGCPLRCPGCCNPQMLTFVRDGARAQRMEVDALAKQVLSTPGIEGVSLLGGEPFAHAEGLAELAQRVRAHGLSVMIYSGYTLAELEARREEEPAVGALLAACDLLVDGPYRRELPETERRWIGSKNQALHFFGDRYVKDDPRFFEKNTVEIRLRRGELVVNGWPDLAKRTLGSGRPR